MFSQRLIRAALLLSLLALLITIPALADDRINLPPYHFGGNTLFCDSDNGCTLLDMNGKFLWNWPQTEIGTAFEELDQTGENTLVGEGEGTYGPMWLWVIPTQATNGNKTLCLQGFDEWGKENEMCFEVTLDWHYLPAPLPVNVAPVEVPDCSMWSIGDSVHLIGTDYQTAGQIIVINADEGTVTVYKGKGVSYTAGCDKIEVMLT
jgi:hypothetical protein